MNEPRPLDSDAAAALAVFGHETAEPLTANAKARVFAQAVQRANAPARPALVAVPLFAAALLAGAFVFLREAPVPAPAVVASKPVPAAPVMLARGATRQVVGAQHTTFRSPQLEVAAQGSVVLFDVTAAGTAVSVESGTAEVRPNAGPARTLSAGQSLWVPSDEAASLALADRPQEIEGCSAARGSAAWTSCLEAQAQGTGLVAETALYELSLEAQARRDLGAAERRLRSYQQRFARGAFAPEVSIALMRGLRDNGATGEARAEAQRYLEIFSDEPRAADVRRFFEQLK